MSRAGNQNYYGGFRYKVLVMDGDDIFGMGAAGTGGKGNAGFSNISIPEITFGVSSPYREGEWDLMPLKQPGTGEASTATFSRGVAPGGTPLWEWVRRYKAGEKWRVDLSIRLMHPTPGMVQKAINLYETFVIRHKPAGDLEGVNNDISVAELEAECEDLSVEEIAA